MKSNGQRTVNTVRGKPYITTICWIIISLIVCMGIRIAGIEQAYGMTGTVVLDENVEYVSSLDELANKFGSSEDNTIINIPEGTVVYMDSVLNVSGETYSINGGTLKRGGEYTGKLINLSKGANLTLDNVVIDGQNDLITIETQSAIYIHKSTLRLTNGTEIKNNKSYENGGAISNYHGIVIVETGCLFEGNESEDGSAIYNNQGNLSIDGATFKESKGSHAIQCESGNGNTVDIKNNSFTGNDGGLEIRSGSYSATVDNCKFIGNEAEYGAGVYVHGSNTGYVLIKNSEFKNNNAIDEIGNGGLGGAIYSSMTIELANNIIQNNHAEDCGGVCIVNVLTTQITGGEISGNTDDNERYHDDIYVTSYADGILELSGGAKVTGNVTVTKYINVHGLVDLNMTVGNEHGSGSTEVYRISAPLDNQSIIELKNNLRIIENANNTVYEIARPVGDYIISDVDFNTFKINSNSGHTGGNVIGLYKEEELGEIAAVYDNEYLSILAYRDSTTKEEEKEPENNTEEKETFELILSIIHQPWIGDVTNTLVIADSNGNETVKVELTEYESDGCIEHSYYDCKISEGSYMITVIDNHGNTISQEISMDSDKSVELIIQGQVQPEEPEAKTYTLTGTIKQGNEILKGITVKLLNESGEEIGTTTTDKNGHYEFVELINGVYSVQVKSGEITGSGTATIVDSNAILDLTLVKPSDDDDDNTGNNNGNTDNEKEDNTKDDDTNTPVIKPEPPQNTEEPQPENKPEEKPEETVPEQEPTQKPVQQPENESVLPYPVEPSDEIRETVETEPEQLPIEDNTTPENMDENNNEQDDIEVPTEPENKEPEELVEDEVENNEMTAKNGTFMDNLKRVLLVATLGLAGILGVGLILLLILIWLRRVKVYNDENTDEYKEADWQLVEKTFIQKEDKGIYSLKIYEDVIKERVTDSFEIKLKKLFIKRHNGDMLMVQIENTELSYSFEIDKKESVVRFEYTDLKEQQSQQAQ